MNSEKFVEHVRITHFYLVVFCILILVSAYILANTSSSSRKALQELHMVEKLLELWDFNEPVICFTKEYEKSTESLVIKKYYGKITLGRDKKSTFTTSIFNEEIHFPIEEDFSFSTTTLINEKLLSSWKALKQKTSSYPVPDQMSDSPVYGNEEYMTTFPASYSLKKPENLAEFHDFWSILNLDHALTIALPKEHSTGWFLITKYDHLAFGIAELELGKNDSTSGYNSVFIWYFSGGIQPGSISVKPFITKDAEDYDSADLLKFKKLHKALEALHSSPVIFMSLSKKNDIKMMYGSGWIDVLDHYPDSPVSTSIIVPVETKVFNIFPQGWLVSQLPHGFPGKPHFNYGQPQKSFPALYALEKQIGNMGFDDIKSYLTERVAFENETTSFSILGVSAPITMLILFGSAIIFSIQCYFYLHLSVLIRRFENMSIDQGALDIPWIGLYSQSQSAIFILLLSAAILPFTTVIILQLQSGWVWHSFILVPMVLLLSVITSIKCIKLWGLPKKLLNT